MAFYHLILGRKKAGDLFQISCSVCRCVSGGYLVVKVWDKLTRCVGGKLEVVLLLVIEVDDKSTHYCNSNEQSKLIPIT